MTYAPFVSIIGDSGQQPSKNVAGFILITDTSWCWLHCLSGWRINANLCVHVCFQLMRDQLQQEEQRERQQLQQQQNAALQYMQNHMAGPPAPTPAISTPQHYQSMQVPMEVLKVRYS